MPSPRRPARLAIGVDTGGTFTDLVFTDGGSRGRLKVLSTPDDPARAVLDGFAQLFGERAPDLFTYGTTVATNAMLERRGARTVLVTTEGFEDVVEIGRQARPDLYDLEPRRAQPLVPPHFRVGVRERVHFDGQVATKLTAAEVRRVVAKVRRLGAESVAVCLLHANASPDHERKLGVALAALGIPVTLSHEVSPTVGEYERTSTAVANAYVQPKVAGHIRTLARSSGAKRLRVMQSSGGAIGAETAAREPVRTMLSGPAGGVAAATALATRLAIARLVTLDMGGTSTDVAFASAESGRTEALRRSETWIGGLPLRVPCLDIHTVGAGGGSIASVDAGGALRVGPESAGADPGPACYGRGDLPTVTDANVVLGRLPASCLLGGDMAVDVARARRAVGSLRRALGASSIEEAAEGIVRVVEGNMERAIRFITVERGEDPRGVSLVPFGGAAGLHACGLADEVGLAEIVVPPQPGLLSAVGVLDGRVEIDRLVALTAVDPTPAWLLRAAAPAVRAVRDEVVGEGFARRAVHVDVFVRARYLRQSIELELPLGPALRARFDRLHQRLFHAADPARAFEVVGLRVHGTSGIEDGPRRRSGGARRTKPKPQRVEAVYIGGRRRSAGVFERESLDAGVRFDGPAIVTEYSSTTLVAPGWTAVVGALGELRLRRRAGRRAVRGDVPLSATERRA
jgi:N-methylhydantoinase A